MTIVVRAALGATMLCVAGAVLTTGPGRGSLLGLAFALLLLTLLAALSRKLSVGRWLL